MYNVCIILDRSVIACFCLSNNDTEWTIVLISILFVLGTVEQNTWHSFEIIFSILKYQFCFKLCSEFHIIPVKKSITNGENDVLSGGRDSAVDAHRPGGVTICEGLQAEDGCNKLNTGLCLAVHCDRLMLTIVTNQ